MIRNIRARLCPTSQTASSDLRRMEMWSKHSSPFFKCWTRSTTTAACFGYKNSYNATICRLARASRYEEAYAVHLLNFPLHHQDWACPNRDGLLKALGGRLLAETQSPEAETALLESIHSSQAFLEKVTQAERGQIKGPRPPHQSPRTRTCREPQASRRASAPQAGAPPSTIMLRYPGPVSTSRD